MLKLGGVEREAVSGRMKLSKAEEERIKSSMAVGVASSMAFIDG